MDEDNGKERDVAKACMQRLKSNPNDLKDKVAAMTELLSVASQLPDISEALSLDEFMCILRLFLINPARTLRLLALKATQSFCKTPNFLSSFVKRKCDYLLARCMERGKQGEEERTSAFKCVKTFLEVDALRLPKSVIQVLLCVADTKDDPCHAISVQLLIELSIRNPRAMAKCGGMKELFRLMIDPPHDELLPILSSVFSYLLDDESTRQFVLVPHDVKVLLAPLTDTFQIDEPMAQAGAVGGAPPAAQQGQQGAGQPGAAGGAAAAGPAEKRKPILGDNVSTIKRWASCVRSSVLMLKSWSGIFIMAASGGFQSMVSALLMPSMNLHSLMLDGLLEIFRIAMPVMGPDFNPFLGAVADDGANRVRSSTSGTDGSASTMNTTASSTSILDLPSRSKIVRHDWMLNYLSLLLINFKRCGLFEALVRLGDKGEQTGEKKNPVADVEEEAMNNKRRENGIKATILLGELLDLSQATLAPAQVKELHTLPTLVRHAATFRYEDGQLELTDKRVRTRAGAMVAHLQQWASLKGSGNQFLEVNTSGANKFRRIRGQNRRLDRIEEIRLKMEWDIDEATLQARLRATGVLATKDWNKWDFRLMAELLEGPLTNSSRIEIALGTKFFKRILSFARPDTNQLFSLPWSARNLRYVQVVCMAMEVLTLSDIGGQFLMKNKLMSSLAKMISDEVEFVQSKQKDDPDRPLSPEKMVRTMVKEYFTLIGTLSGNTRGISILNETKIFSLLVPLISSGRSDLCKVIMMSMDYSQAGSSRVLLSKVLQNKTMPIRYLATRHLHFLLRAGAGDFKTWGIEFACKALRDPEPRIVRAVVAVLDEASDDEEMLNSFISRKPEMLLDKDHPGKFLAYRFLSTEKGFEYLNQTDFIQRELALWAESETENYVKDVEEKLLETVFSDSYKQTETQVEGGVVNVMPHLYGELAKTEQGFALLKGFSHFEKSMEAIKQDSLSDLARRAALWSAGAVGASSRGLLYLIEHGILESIFDLCVTCPSLSTRGTCLMVLGMIGSTPEGREQLRLAGWRQPHAEIYRLVAVPNEETLTLLMQVPQPVYTGGSWTPNFVDPELVMSVVKSARQERVAAASAEQGLSASATMRISLPALKESANPEAAKVALDAHRVTPVANADDEIAIPVVVAPVGGRGVSGTPGAGRAVGRGLGRGASLRAPPSAPAKPKAMTDSVIEAPEEEAPVPPPARRQPVPPSTRTASPPPGAAPVKKPMPRVPTSARREMSTSKVPPILRLNEALEKSSYDPNPLKESFSEEKKTVLKLVVDMTSHITTEKALRQLKKMRMQSPELFTDPEVFLSALRLLEMYRFKLMIRRFIYDLFGECFISHVQFQKIWDEDVTESPRKIGVGLKQSYK